MTMINSKQRLGRTLVAAAVLGGIAAAPALGFSARQAAACDILDSTTSECSRPATPANLTATAQGAGTIVLNWTNTPHESTYTQARVTEAGHDLPQRYISASPLGTPDHATISNLDYGAYYCFSIRSERVDIRLVSPSWSNWACAQTGYPDFGHGTPAPSPSADPSNLRLESQNANYIEIGWTYTKHDSGMVGFKIYRDGIAVGAADPLPIDEYAYTDVFFVTGVHTYAYRVCAVWRDGEFLTENCSASFSVRHVNVELDPNATITENSTLPGLFPTMPPTPTPVPQP